MRVPGTVASTAFLLLHIRRPLKWTLLPRRPEEFPKGEFFRNHRLLGCVLWENFSTVERTETITTAAPHENNSSLVTYDMGWSTERELSGVEFLWLSVQAFFGTFPLVSGESRVLSMPPVVVGWTVMSFKRLGVCRHALPCTQNVQWIRRSFLLPLICSNQNGFRF